MSRVKEPGRVSLLCPYCRKQVGTQPESVLGYYDPKFRHAKCTTEKGRGVTSAHLIVDRPTKDLLKVLKPGKNDAFVVKKVRKGRSDKGKKRGAYGPRKNK